MKTRTSVFNKVGFLSLLLLSVLWLVPLFLVLMNSFKPNVSVTQEPFSPPNADTFVGMDNYVTSMTKTNFLVSVGWSFFITIASVALIILLTSMAAWYIVRVKAWFTNGLYYLLVFSMIVPFQMVMYTMAFVANRTHLDNPFGIILLYAGFGAGLSVFIFTGFIRSIPISLEEAALIDGASAWRVFFSVIFPILRPTAITIAVLNAMWIWNDYLLPNLVIGSSYWTIPIAVQKFMTGSYGYKDMGGFMAMLVVAIIPIITFYLFGQRHIIKGVAAGAVKG